MLQSQVNIDTTIDLRGIKINLISVKFIGKKWRGQSTGERCGSKPKRYI